MDANKIEGIVRAAFPTAWESARNRLNACLAEARYGREESEEVYDRISDLMSRAETVLETTGCAFVTAEGARLAVRAESEPPGALSVASHSLRKRADALLAFVGLTLREKGYRVEYDTNNDMLQIWAI